MEKMVLLKDLKF